MHTDLVRAACLNAHAHKRESAKARFDALHHFIVRDGRASSTGASRCHARSTQSIAADGGGDGARILLEVSMHQRDIGLADLTAREHLRQLEMRCVIAGNNDESAGLLVQPVNDAWA